MSPRRQGGDEFLRRAATIVDKALAGKGELGTIRHAGRQQTFEETVSASVWDGYVAAAGAEVDAGNWREAHQIARDYQIGRVAAMLSNQAQSD